MDSVPKTQIPDLLLYFDFLYIGLQKQSLFRFGISPNKLIDYMMSSKPVIQAIDAGNDMVKEAECGISIPPEEPDKLVKACEELMAFPEEKLILMGEKGRNFVLLNHDYQVLAKKYILAIEKA